MIQLVVKNLFNHKLRFVLTVGSLAVAMFLLCVLQSLVVALDAGVRAASSSRLIVQSAVSLFVSLPESYQGKISAVDGVEETLKYQWFGGIYQDQSNFFAQFAVDADKLLDVYHEMDIIDGSADDFIQKRTACIVGEGLVKRFDWMVGDTIPIIGALFPRNDGAPWEFHLAGVYKSDSSNVDNNQLFFHFDYLRESLEGGSASGPPGVGVYVLKTASGTDQIETMAAVDGMFENGPQVVQTTTEAEFQAQFVSMVGNIPMFVSSIGGGVTIAVLLAVLNTMLMAGREQRRDIGILKALGFTDTNVATLMMGQSLVLVLLGGGLGIALAKGTSEILTGVLGTMFPGYTIAPSVMLGAAVLTLGIGLLAGIMPALSARRLEVVDALRSN
ncbi:MAG: putative ABC transport system permease protein [Planctomycetota bacterium]